MRWSWRRRRSDDEAPRSIVQVKRAREAEWLRIPGVASVGIGTDDDGSPAIVVGVTALDPVTERRIPVTVEGHPVVVRRVGPIEAL